MPSEQDRRLLRDAIELAHHCPPSTTAFSVGAIIADAHGNVLASGYSRQHEQTEHAEEAALGALADEMGDPAGLTLYSSLEPCSARASRPTSCARHILDSGIGRIVFAWHEPDIFVDGTGAQQLQEAGRTVVEIPELADEAREPNRHLPGIGSA